METSLAKTVSEIGFRSSSGLIRSCDNPELLRKVLSEGLFQAVNLYSDMTPESVSLMMGAMLDEYQFEPTDVIIEAIKDLASGKKKIYGRVTPNDMRELIKEKMELVAIERERKHEEMKKGAYVPRNGPTTLRDYIKGQKRK